MSAHCYIVLVSYCLMYPVLTAIQPTPTPALVMSQYFKGFYPINEFKEKSKEKPFGHQFVQHYYNIERICSNLQYIGLTCMRISQPYNVTIGFAKSNRESLLHVTKDIAFGASSMAVPIKPSVIGVRLNKIKISTDCVADDTLSLRLCSVLSLKPNRMFMLKTLPENGLHFEVSHELGRLRWRFNGKTLRPFPSVIDVPRLIDKKSRFITTELFFDSVRLEYLMDVLLKELYVDEPFANVVHLRVIYILVIWLLLFNNVGIHHGDLHNANILIDIPPNEFKIEAVGMEHVHIIDLDFSSTPFYKRAVKGIREDIVAVLDLAESVMSKDSKTQFYKNAKEENLCFGNKNEENRVKKYFKCSSEQQRKMSETLCDSLRIEDELLYNSESFVGLPTCHNLLKSVELITPLTVE